MSDLTFSPPHSENMELAAANRRLTTAILGMTLLTGLIACLSYLAGRTVTQIRTETATVVRTEIPPGPVVISPLTNKPSPAFAPDPVPVHAAGLYLQVGLMNPAIDRTLQDRLVMAGYSVRVSPMENSPVSRVMVGPIQSTAQQRELESKLRSEGFQFFPRRY
ncbi:MAG: SPOR domain-containing protein [Bryobacteraceae bacterium]